VWSTFTSCILDMNSVKKMMIIAQPPTRQHLFSIDLATTRAKMIPVNAMNALANEVLLPFDIQFEVTGIMTLSSGITIVHVKEVVPAPSTQGLSTGYPRLDFISPGRTTDGVITSKISQCW